MPMCSVREDVFGVKRWWYNSRHSNSSTGDSVQMCSCATVNTSYVIMLMIGVWWSPTCICVQGCRRWTMVSYTGTTTWLSREGVVGIVHITSAPGIPIWELGNTGQYRIMGNAEGSSGTPYSRARCRQSPCSSRSRRARSYRADAPSCRRRRCL